MHKKNTPLRPVLSSRGSYYYNLNNSLAKFFEKRDKFYETHFLADFDIFLSDLKNGNVPGEALCEIEAVAKAYAKRVKQTPSDKGVERTRKYLKSNALVAVPYDKGVGFCVMRKDTFESKLFDTLDSKQFSESNGTSDAIILKIERNIKNELFAMRKKTK